MRDDLTIRPYLLRAVYEWCVDNKLTPYLAAQGQRADVHLPPVADGEKIALNISGEAVRDLVMSNENVSFTARFQGATFQVILPIGAIIAIYAQETGEGFSFSAILPASAENTKVEDNLRVV